MASGHRKDYYTLISSLPPLLSLTRPKQPPLSELRLTQRLRLLAEPDATALATLRPLLVGRDAPLAEADAALVRQAEQVSLWVRSDTLQEVAQWLLELRLVLAALRGQHQPTLEPDWTCWRRLPLGDWIWRRRTQADYGLAYRLPWLEPLRRHLAQGDAWATEQWLLQLQWDYLQRQQGLHAFDFEAVALYVLRWELARQWQAQQRAPARERLAALVQQAMDQQPPLFGGMDVTSDDDGR